MFPFYCRLAGRVSAFIAGLHFIVGSRGVFPFLLPVYSRPLWQNLFRPRRRFIHIRFYCRVQVLFSFIFPACRSSSVSANIFSARGGVLRPPAADIPRFTRRPPRTERTPAGIRTRISGKPHTVGMCRSARKTTASRARAAYAIPPPRFAPPRAAVLRVSVRSFAANPQRSFSDIAPTLLALRAKTDRYLPPCRSVSLRCATVAARTAGYCGYVAADGNFRANVPAALPSFAYTLPYTATKVNPFSRNGRRLSKF